MPGCGCSVCKTCFKSWFQMVIREKSVKHFNCPICNKPDIENARTSEYFLEFVSLVRDFNPAAIHLIDSC